MPATSAEIWNVTDICFDKFGNLFLADQNNYRVRKVNPSGIISTIAGSGIFSSTSTGDGGPATAAGFNILYGLTSDDTGNIYVSDFNGAKVRKVNTSGIISTVAGNGVYTYSGDGILATNAQIAPGRLTFDNSKNLVIADQYNRRVFKVDHAGILHCIAGNGMTGFSGDGGAATAASVDYPAGVSYDICGNLYIAESTNRRVRKVAFNPSCNPTFETKVNAGGAITIYPNPAIDILNIDNVGYSSTYALINIMQAHESGLRAC